MNEDELIDAIWEYMRNNADSLSRLFPAFLYATWLGSESVDSNLSHIRLANGTEIHGVPKYAHVTGLSAGVQIQCANTGEDKPLCITGIVVGDITLYEAP